MISDSALIKEAFEARKMAYAPYSGYFVGAALLCRDGTVYRGCNIESASYSPTNCAERTAFFKAISEGQRQFLAIAVVGAQQNAKPEAFPMFYPCGVCRQVMMEFCDPATFRILVCNSETYFETHTLASLLPCAFGPKALKQTAP